MGVITAVTFFVALVIYLLPTLIAADRKHRNQGSIFIINLLLGWLFIPWVLALAWSFSANVQRKSV